ncbi:MAG: transposase [Candidatus Methylomirabilales bacterium]
MSRPLRIEYPSAVYHLTARGNARQNIFRDATDRQAFLDILGEVIARYEWLCHAYCLMDNHYHLLIETLKPTLSRGMRQLNGVYTQAFNRRHSRVGHLFQGRYKAIVVEKQAHLLELCRYVVLNPVRAGAKRSVAAWKWSSYRATAGLASAPGFLTVAWVLGQFGQRRSGAQTRYRAFVHEGLGRQPWQQLQGQIYLGSATFIQRHTKRGARMPEIPRVQWRPVRPTLAQLFRQRGERAIGAAYREYGYRLREIAEHLGVHYATVSRKLRVQETGKRKHV